MTISMTQLEQLPPGVIYVGLAAALLAPLVAGFNQRSLTVAILLWLRLAIGWHFLFEGLHKLHSFAVGTALVNDKEVKPFSSEGYFREATGPLGPLMRKQIGDPDADVLARYDVTAGGAGGDRLPAALAGDWNAYFERFAAHYGLDPAGREAAAARFKEQKEKAAKYLAGEEPGERATVEKKYSHVGTVEVPNRVKDRVAEFRAKKAEVDEVADRRFRFGKDVEKGRVQKLKQDLAQLRTGLQADLDRLTVDMQDALKAAVAPDKLAAAGPVPDEKPERKVEQLDRATAWFLTAVGALLLIGLFTRLACVAAGLFLVMTYLAVPSFPWSPAPPNQEGNYLFVSKNVVEMLALFALATLPTGRWMGLDALLAGLGRALRGKPKEPNPAAQPNVPPQYQFQGKPRRR